MTCDDDGTSSRIWQLSPAWPHYRPGSPVTRLQITDIGWLQPYLVICGCFRDPGPDQIRRQLRWQPRPQSLCHDEISWKLGNDKQLLTFILCLEKVYMTIDMFSPHTFIALNIEPNEKFSQAFHGAGHKCISRECFNWMRISQHLHTSTDTDKYIRSGARGISGDIFIHCGHTRCRAMPALWLMPASVNILILVPGICFCASQIFAFPVITHFISGLKILQKRKELKLALTKKGVGLLYPISNPAFHP